MILCASPEYLRQRGTPVHSRDLGALDVLSYRLSAIGKNREFIGPDGPVVAHVTPVLLSNSGDTRSAVALAHAGLILQPSFLVGDDSPAGPLVKVMTEFWSIELGIYAVYPSPKFVSPEVRLLIDFLVKAFRRPTWRDLGSCYTPAMAKPS